MMVETFCLDSDIVNEVTSVISQKLVDQKQFLKIMEKIKETMIGFEMNGSDELMNAEIDIKRKAIEELESQLKCVSTMVCRR